MKNVLLFVAIAGLIASCTNQNELELKSLSNEVIFTKVDKQPTYPGGMPAFFEYTQTNLAYPTNPKLADVQGKVFIQFIVTKNGSIEEAFVLKGLEASVDKAALELINNSPDWIPGTQKGIPVNVRMVLPISFGTTSKTEVELLPGTLNLNQNIDKMPEYKGGIKDFYTYVLANIQYPQEARRKGIQGKVMVQFTVTKEGKITNANVLKGLGEGCDKAALDIVKNSNHWAPGQFEGKPVDVQMVLPISFKLN